MATEERKAQLEFEVGDNTKPGIDSIKAGVAGIKDAAVTAATGANAALEGLARAGEQTADRLERKTVTLANSIKRQISTTQRELATLKAEASGGGQADIFDNLIRMRGGDANALKPLVDSLRQVRSEFDLMAAAQKQAAATQLFERQHQEAKKLVQDSEYVRMWTQALEQKEAAERKTASQNAFVTSLKAQSDAIGKTRADLLELQAAQMGVATQAAPYIAKLREQEQALVQNGKVLNAYGKTAKETAANLRQVPAQITDIVVSLQGGQAPLTVLLQQGGQLRDIFGGIAPAARALGGALVGLVSATTVVATGVGALALAYYQGSQEIDGYNKALVLTGNAAGTTSAQLKDAAVAVSQVVGTQSAAAEVLAALASTGEVAGRNLQKFTETTLRAERDLGISVKETVKNFEALGESPVEASVKLNKQYGYLTASIYEQIRALRDQGRETEAASLAQTTYANAMDTKSAQLRTQLGAIERAWYGIKTGAKEAWDAMLNVGRADSSADTLRQLQAELQKKETQPLAVDNEAMRASRQKGIDYLKERISLLQSDERMQRRGAEAAAQRQRSEEAGIEFSKIVYDSKTKEQKVEIEIARVRKLGVEAGKSDLEIEKQVAIIRANNAKSTKGDDRAAQSRQAELADLRAKIKAEADYTERLKEQGIQAEKNNAGLKLTDEIEGQLKGKLDAKTRAHLEQKLALAQQLDTLTKVRVEEEERAKAIAKTEEASRKQIQAVYDEATATEQQRMRLDETTEAYGRSAVAVAQLALEQNKLRLAEAEGSDSFKPEYVENLRRLVKEQEKLVGSLQVAEFEKVNRTLDEQITLGNEQNALLTLEISLVGRTELERKKIIAAREAELKLAKQIREIDQSSMTDTDKETAKEKARERNRIEVLNATNKVIVDDWNKTTEQINSSLTDALLRGFESGKGFAENLRDTVINMFKTMILRPTISAILSPISGAISGLVNQVIGGVTGGGGGGILDIISMGKNAYSLYGSLTSGQGFLGSIGSFFGMGPAAGTGLTAGGSGLGLSTGASGLGLQAPASFGSVGGGSGGLGALGGAGVFAAVAALVLNAVGAFRSERRNGVGLMGTLGGGNGLSPFEEWREGGTLFDGPSFNTFNPVAELESKRRQLQALKDSGQGNTQQAATLQLLVDNLEEQYGDLAEQSAKQSKAIQSAYDVLRTNVGDMADVLGLGSEAVRAFTTQLGGSAKGLNFEGLNADQISAKIAEALATANNDLAQQVIGTWVTETARRTRIESENIGSQGEDMNIVYTEVDDSKTTTRYVESEFAREGEKAIDTLTRLATSLTGVNAMFSDLGVTLLEASLSGGDAASSLADAFGGLERMAALTNDYYQNFYTEEERRAKQQEKLDAEFAKLGIDTPKNRDEFRALVTNALNQVEVQRAARENLSRTFSQTIADAAKDGFSIEELSKTGLADSIDPSLLGGGKADPAMLGKLNGFLAGVSDLAGKGLSDADFSKGIAGLVQVNSEVLGLGEDADKTAATLIGLSGTFAELNESAEDAQDRIDKERADARDKAFRALERAVAAEKKLLQERIGIAKDLAATLRDLFDNLRSNVSELLNEVENVRVMRGDEGRAFIEQALVVARTTGYLPENDQIAEAISAARGNLGNERFATQFDADRERLGLASQLSDLAKLTEDQLTDAERTIRELEEQNEALDKTLAYWREQIEIANGTYEAVKSVADAIRDLTTLMFPDIGDTRPEQIGGGKGTGGAVFGGSSGASGGTTTPQSKYRRPVYLGTAGVGYVGVSAQEEARLDKYNAGYHAFDGTGDAAGLAAFIATNKLTPEEMSALSGNYATDWEKWYRENGIPAFEVGTNRVPHDMLAVLHKDEAVVPKAYNPWLQTGGGSSQDNSRVVSRLEAMQDDQRVQVAETLRLLVQMNRRFSNWDTDGLPATRDEEETA